MHTGGFEREIVLRREIGQLQEKVADLMDIQIRSELYRNKVLREFEQLEDENSLLKFEIEGLRRQLAHPKEATR